MSRDSREFRDLRDSRDSSIEKTPFLMTPLSVSTRGYKRNPAEFQKVFLARGTIQRFAKGVDGKREGLNYTKNNPAQLYHLLERDRER